MESKNTILFELEQISPAVANLNKDNVYSVPVDYFENLSIAILAEINSENIFTGAKGPIYTAPNGYFNGLAENILSIVKQQSNSSKEVFDELQNIAPTLNTISKQNNYALPNDYFKGLNIVAPIEKTAKIIGFSKWKKIFTYVAAAVFAGVLALGGIKYIDNHSSPSSFDKEVAKSSDEELKQALDNYSATAYNVTDDQDGASIFEGTSEEELQQFLKEQPEMAEKSNKDI